MPEFVHLHLHTEYSLLDGACRIEELLDRAAELNMPALAVTEHGNMFSSVIFHDAARKRGVKPILGCEVYVAPESRLTKSGTPGETANHLVLLAETLEGYHNLIRLVSSGYTDGFYYKPRIDKDLLARHAKGLIGLSSCLKGEVATGIRTEKLDRAIKAAATYRDILGPGNFFLEMQYQGIDEQRIVNNGLLPIAADLDMPLVVTNDVHYLKQTDYTPHDILLCIGTGKTVNDAERLRYHGDQFFLKTPEEMWTVFAEHPQALRNTMRIAERCDVTLPSGENFLPNFEVPGEFTLDDYFEHMTRQGFEQRLPRLRELSARGALRHSIEDYAARLTYEIEMIKTMKYPGYFLIVWDFIRYAREHGIPVGPGRGSAAGSLVAYSLRITDVDPLEYDLIFERFLNPERVSLPDIDIDFCERRRGEVIEYVTRKYGRENVAQIITFGTMKARAVVRDVGRALDMPFADVDRVAKLIPPSLDMTLDKAVEENPALKELASRDERVGHLLESAKRLEGMTRHASVHAAGVVIAPRPIVEFAPLYKSQKDEITTQWAMKEVERVGLLKMDFLGLSTLTLLFDAVAEIKRTAGEDLKLEDIPLNDQKTYQLFCDGLTNGVFQFESSGMKDTLRKAKPQRLEDLIALNALYRPGPLRGGVVDDYIARKHGRVEIKYELPGLEPILKETYGVIAYQEQVMRIAVDVAGFTMGEADLLRKAMGKKNAAVMQAQRQHFVDGAQKRGVSAKKAAKLFDLMEFFAGYGFNKSHSTTYAYLAYQTAYLKANYPWHFMAALLTIEAQNTDKLALYLAECRELGVPILAPDVNASELAFTVTAEGVRYGLMAVKNVGEGAIESILAVRKEQGRINSLFELCEHVDLRLVNKRVLESLAKAGALDSLCEGHASTPLSAGASTPLSAGASTPLSAGASTPPLSAGASTPLSAGASTPLSAGASTPPLSAGASTPLSAGASTPPLSAGASTPLSAGASTPPLSAGASTPLSAGASIPLSAGAVRARLFAAVDRALEHGSRRQKDRDQGQSDLFGGGDPTTGEPADRVPLPDVPAWNDIQQLGGEKEALGFFMSGHPIERHAEDLRAFGARPIAELSASEADIWVGGIVSGLRPLKTRKGDRMCVFMLEDPTGTLETVVFPETFLKFGHLGVADAMLVVRGKFEKDDESARLIATEILPMSALRERVAREVAIRVSMPPCGRGTLEALAELLARHRGDRRVSIELEMTNGGGRSLRVSADVGQVRVRPSEQLVADVEKLCGEGSVTIR